MGVTAGESKQTPSDTLNTILTESFISQSPTQMYHSNKTNLQQPSQSSSTSTNPEVSSDTPLLLGCLDILADPEAKEPPEILGIMQWQPARILIDSDCSTYVLSTDFAEKAKITLYPMKPVPVQLVVWYMNQCWYERS